MTDFASRPWSLPSLADVVQRVGGLGRRAASWRRYAPASPAWTAAVLVILLAMAMPVGAILVLALDPAESVWAHLASTVLPEALANTIGLALLAAAGALVVGTGAAWLVTMYRFPGRAVVDRLLVAPLAIPTYIAAYCYAEVLDYAGPVQGFLRASLGWSSPRDYWFPDIRSLGGAAFVMAAVLYPYVYLTARASFVLQSVCVLEVARTLGRTAMGTFRSIALPLARPALAAGTALVVMEVLNDLGAVQHLGVPTLSASIYATWLQRSNLGGAAQLATVLLVLIVVLFAVERWARGGGKVHHTTGRYRAIPFQDIEGWKGYGALGLCLVPFAAGFVLPVSILVQQAMVHGHESVAGGVAAAAMNSLVLALLSAAACVALALVLIYARRVAPNAFIRPAVRLSGLGYALPGTVLAIGVLIPLAWFDNRVDALLSDRLGISTGLIVSGSIFGLVLAYTIRFLAVALGGIEAGFDRVSPNLDAAARALGSSALATLWRVHLPLLVPALGAAGLLVFVDAMKELPTTLLLRPFNFETLATQIYGFAALEQVGAGALRALVIVLVGLAPLFLVHSVIAGGRARGGSARSPGRNG